MEDKIEKCLKEILKSYNIVITEENRKRNFFYINQNLEARDLVYLFCEIENTFNVHFTRQQVLNEHLMFFDKILEDILVLESSS